MVFGVLASIVRGVSTPSRALRGLYANRGILAGNQVGDDKLSPSKCVSLACSSVVLEVARVHPLAHYTKDAPPLAAQRAIQAI